MKTLDRRSALKTAALVAGGLLTTQAIAIDAPPRPTSFAGSWTFEGRRCAIFQQGPVLLLVNERGHLATAHITGPNTFKVLSGQGWESGLIAQLIDHGERILWPDEKFWVQA
jgi:hypothetical protein